MCSCVLNLELQQWKTFEYVDKLIEIEFESVLKSSYCNLVKHCIDTSLYSFCSVELMAVHTDSAFCAENKETSLNVCVFTSCNVGKASVFSLR